MSINKYAKFHGFYNIVRIIDNIHYFGGAQTSERAITTWFTPEDIKELEFLDDNAYIPYRLTFNAQSFYDLPDEWFMTNMELLKKK